MKLRRGLAISAAVTVVSASALAAATPAALATPALGHPAVAAPADARTSAPTLSVKGFPAQITAGEPAVTFSAVFSNTTGLDLIFLPFLRVRADHTDLLPEQQRVRYQDVDTNAWHDAVAISAIADQPGAPMVLGPVDAAGQSTEDSWLYIPAGESLAIPLKFALTADAKADTADVEFLTSWIDLDSLASERYSVGSADARFKIVAPGGSTASPSATTSASATATTPASATPSHPGSASPSASATVTPTATATAGPSASLTGTPSASASATASARPTTPAAPAPVTSGTAAPATGQGGGAVPAAALTSAELGRPKASAATVAKAKAKAATRPSGGANLATTGGGDDSTGLAIAGAAVLAAGVGTLVVLRRRKGGTTGA
ncbi:LPXTG cell wall anchor domain-containing protein [Kitasatospora sp. NPDC050543]|uniref:LPXTG cell wall anchor domain-containing protein n=1 Tax=Kitasatospora sp. NPDC050543 TaxID=3364054 RepID=UPI00378802CB